MLHAVRWELSESGEGETRLGSLFNIVCYSMLLCLNSTSLSPSAHRVLVQFDNGEEEDEIKTSKANQESRLMTKKKPKKKEENEAIDEHELELDHTQQNSSKKDGGERAIE